MRFCYGLLLGLIFLSGVQAQPARPLLVTTLNCYLFFGGGSQTNRDFKQPRTAPDYRRKVNNLVSLLPADAPLLVGFQEVGKLREVEQLAQTAANRYHRRFLPLFVKGKDTFTSENVGAMLCLDYGWGLSELPARADELDTHLSKHLVLHLTNSVTALDVCVVHLLRAIGSPEKQIKQNEALKIWADQQLKKNPRANVVILGDFNEAKHPGDAGQSLECLVAGGKPLVDTLTLAPGKVKTHADGHAYDRILISPALAKGESWLKFQAVSSHEHSHGKGDERLWFTDHFPLTVAVTGARPAATR